MWSLKHEEGAGDAREDPLQAAVRALTGKRLRFESYRSLGWALPHLGWV